MQSHPLSRRHNARTGEVQESDVRHVVYYLQGCQTTDVVNSVTPLDVRSRRMLFEVLKGYCTYFLRILLVNTQITNLDPSYWVLVKVMFIYPFSIGVLYNMTRHLVGMNVCTGREFSRRCLSAVVVRGTDAGEQSGRGGGAVVRGRSAATILRAGGEGRARTQG